MSMEVSNHIIDWLPAYVLDALTDDETSQVAKHLAGCQTCQAELARMQQVADELPLALAQTAPPPEVKARLMTAIHSRQGKSSASSQATFRMRLEGLLRMRLPALGLALIVVMALGNLLLWRQIYLANSQSKTPMRVLALVNTNDSPQALGTLIMGQNGDYGTLVADHLAILDNEHQYQVWLSRDGARISAGLFSVNYEGYASLELSAPLPLIQYDTIGITIEPVGGSPDPTGVKILGGELTH